MSRLDTMARFAEPDEKDNPQVVWQCECCYEDICEGADAYVHKGYKYCSEECVFSDLDVFKIQAER